MAILLGKNKKKGLSTNNKGDQWYPHVKSLGTVTEKEVARQIADEVTLNYKEAEMALALLEKVVMRNIMEGKTVMLGDWAFFYPTVTSEGADTEDEVTVSKIRSVKMHLKVGKAFHKALQKARFLFVDDL